MLQSVTTATDTCSTTSFSSATSFADVNLNDINVFQPVGYSQIPTDICLVELDNNPVDEFEIRVVVYKISLAILHKGKYFYY